MQLLVPWATIRYTTCWDHWIHHGWGGPPYRPQAPTEKIALEAAGRLDQSQHSWLSRSPWAWPLILQTVEGMLLANPHFPGTRWVLVTHRSHFGGPPLPVIGGQHHFSRLCTVTDSPAFTFLNHVEKDT